MTPRSRQQTTLASQNAPQLRADGPDVDRLKLLAIEHPEWSAAQIYRAMEPTRKPGQPREQPPIPLRTVQRFLAKFNRIDESGEWSLTDAELSPEDAALVLPIIRWALDTGRRRPTRSTCEWIVRIRRIDPEIDEPSCYFLAQYGRRGDVSRIETLLMYRPWTDDGLALGEAYASGRVGFDVPFSAGYEQAAIAAKTRRHIADKARRQNTAKETPNG